MIFCGKRIMSRHKPKKQVGTSGQAIKKTAAVFGPADIPGDNSDGCHDNSKKATKDIYKNHEIIIITLVGTRQFIKNSKPKQNNKNGSE